MAGQAVGEKSDFCCRWKAPCAAELSSSLFYPSAGTASLSQPPFNPPPAAGKVSEKDKEGQKKRMGEKKSIFWEKGEQACGEQG